MKKISFLLPVLIIALIFCPGCANQKSTQSSSDAVSFSREVGAFISLLKNSPSKSRDGVGNIIPQDHLLIDIKWEGNICKTRVTNIGKTPVHPSDIILFDITEHGLDRHSEIYGEGFQMLDQKGGTLDSLKHIGAYADEVHYRIPGVDGLHTAYGVLAISLKPDDHILLGFTSCNRFIGRISYDAHRMIISLDAEGIEIKPGESQALEDFLIMGGSDRRKLFDHLADAIATNHPRRVAGSVPTGWCSWYCYGPSLTNQLIEENLRGFSKNLPELKYILIDDGYQPFMGDWLDSNPSFGDLQKTLETIRANGFEPAIWVAPFIAEKKSRVFTEHPDWFVKDKDGSPLLSSKIGFGGWRNGPWYVLDGTNPEAQKHLQNVFREMREKFGINYFKLDANYWGAIHGGVHYDRNATRIEAYRRGMEAVLKGCDEKTVVLGCNAPIWPSFGLVTAMRTSNDISRSWPAIKTTAIENFCRAWQNGKLWNSDPDCVLLTNDAIFSDKTTLKPDEWMFHATAIHAVGGLIFTGDKMSNLKDPELSTLKKLLPPTGQGAHFLDDKMETAFTDMGDKQYLYFFNWDDARSIELTIKLKSKSKLTDFWSGAVLGVFEGSYTVKDLAPHKARMIVASGIDKNNL